MSMMLVYQSLPPDSDFYSRLQNDRSFRVLASSLFTAGSVFHIFQYVPESFNEYMKEAISRHPDVFCGTELEISLIIGDFREVLRTTCRDYPEIVYNAGSLEQSFEEISDALMEELSRRKFENVDDIIATLLYGDTTFGDWISPEGKSYTLALTSREAVRKGAGILRQIEPETLFPGGDDGDEGWYSEDFREWKKFYLSADDLGAEIIMDVL
jgi:hypothetical protein